MAGCNQCFFGGVKIGAKGNEDSPLIIVGESPGIMEVALEKPFVGPSGELLHKALLEAGVERLGKQPRFTNAIHCLPRSKTPEKLIEACTRCNSRLMNEVNAYPRKIILALGSAALQSLMGDYSLKITRERGKLFKHPSASIGMIPTVHPAFLLRGQGNYLQFKRDIQYAIDLAVEGEKRLMLPDGTSYWIAENSDDVQKTIGLLNQADHIASDIETTGFSFVDDKILCVGLQYKPKESVIIPEHLIVPELFEAEAPYVWHNGKFDIKFLRHQYNAKRARVDEDTMLLSYALNERRGIHDLDQVASDWIGSANHKGMLDQFTKGTIKDPVTGKKRKRNYGDVPKDILHKYLALDLSDTYQLFPVLRNKVRANKDLEKFYTQHLIPGSEYLAKVETSGMRVDFGWVNENKQRLTAQMSGYEGKINKLATDFYKQPTVINPRSWQQLQNFMYRDLKLHVNPNAATDWDTLITLPDHPVVRTLIDYREVQKSYSTYVKNLLEKEDGTSDVHSDGRVHQSYLLHGTPTSRLACNGPNLQNIPRDHKLRGQYYARPGYGILECDYSQAELRCLAALSGCPDLSAIFLQGKDLHVEFSKFLFGEHFTREDKMAAKTVNFGIPYGRTAISIALDADLRLKSGRDITVREAQSWIDGWGERFPVAWDFIGKCRMAPLLNQTMTTVFGNKKRPGVVSREILNDLQNQSANFFHQSTASNLTIRAGIELFDILRSEWDTHIVNTVHDCIVTEVPLFHGPQYIMDVAKVITDKMSEIPTRYEILSHIPFKAEAEFGHRWGNLLKFEEIEKLYAWNIDAIPQYVEPH